MRYCDICNNENASWCAQADYSYDLKPVPKKNNAQLLHLKVEIKLCQYCLRAWNARDVKSKVSKAATARWAAKRTRAAARFKLPTGPQKLLR